MLDKDDNVCKCNLNQQFYLKLTDACQTKARSKNSTGMIGNTSTRGSKGAYASGNFASKKAIMECLYKILKPVDTLHCRTILISIALSYNLNQHFYKNVKRSEGVNKLN